MTHKPPFNGTKTVPIFGRSFIGPTFDLARCLVI